MPVHGHRDGKKGLVRITPESSSFYVGGPPLQLVMVRPCSIQGTWFLSHLPLEGTEPYPNLVARNRRYPGYRTPTINDLDIVEDNKTE
jgi:hypothetical protein